MGAGISGSSSAHSPSFSSFAERSPARTYWRRVISVQAIVSSLESLQIRWNHNQLKSLNFFFGQALSAGRNVPASAGHPQRATDTRSR